MEEEAAKAIKIKNPIGEDMSLMRTMLAPSLLNTVVRNLRRGNENGRLYEFANVYIPKQMPMTDMPEEKKHLCTAVFGKLESFYSAKGVFEALAEQFGIHFDYISAEVAYLHPGKCANVLFEGKVVGCLGELAPDIAESLAIETYVYLGELDYDALESALNKPVKFERLPKFPVIKRDLALVAEEKVTCAEIEKAIREGCKFVTEVKLFDVYRGAQIGEGKKSMAFSITLTPTEKAIQPEDADAQMKRILRALQDKLSVVLR